MRVLVGLGLFVVSAALSGLLLLLGGRALSPGVLIYCLGVCGAVAASLCIGLPQVAGRVLRSAALWLACLVFALPLYWMVSTSFKYQEESLASPPRWLPEIPAVVLRSPYRTSEVGPRGITEVGRSLLLRAVTLRDAEQVDYPVPDALGRWQAEGPAQLTRQGDEVRVSYDLRAAARFTLRASLPLPLAAARFLGVSVPMRQDRSWHRLRVVVRAFGRRYETTDALYLGGRRSQELTFRLPGHGTRDERDLGVWPLDDTGPASVPPGTVELALEVERASAMQVLLRKWGANYEQVYLLSPQRLRYLGNSLLVVLLTVVGQVFGSSLSAYAFARLRWPGRDGVFYVLLMTLMVPSQVTMVPSFLLMRQLGLYNTLAALWLPSFFGSAVYIFLLRQFMKGIPMQLEDAARLDGCGPLRIYWSIVMPLLRPALATVVLFTFVNTWNDFLGPLLYLNDPRLYPLSLGLYELRGVHGDDQGLVMAAATLMTLPVAAIFLLAQRSFLQSIRFGGIKG